MTKTPWTDEQRKAAGDRLRQAREKKQQLKDQAELPNEELKADMDAAEAEPEAPTPDPEPTITQTEYATLLRHMAELETRLATQAAQPAAAPSPYPNATVSPQINAQGRLVGVHEKYGVDPANYANPTERLAKEPKLQRFAFDINYELDFKVATVQYQTQDGMNVKEPKFTLELIKVMIDDETGEPTDGRFVLRTNILHEDPQAALEMARTHNVNPDDFGGETGFLNEMRYLRMRDWLLEAFYPPKTQGKKNKKEMVVGNRLVQYYEVSSVDSAKIEFGDLNGRI